MTLHIPLAKCDEQFLVYGDLATLTIYNKNLDVSKLRKAYERVVKEVYPSLGGRLVVPKKSEDLSGIDNLDESTKAILQARTSKLSSKVEIVCGKPDDPADEDEEDDERGGKAVDLISSLDFEVRALPDEIANGLLSIDDLHHMDAITWEKYCATNNLCGVGGQKIPRAKDLGTKSTLARVIVLEGSPRSLVFFSIAHIIGDATTYFYLMQRWGEFYNQLEKCLSTSNPHANLQISGNPHSPRAEQLALPSKGGAIPSKKPETGGILSPRASALILEASLRGDHLQPRILSKNLSANPNLSCNPAASMAGSLSSLSKAPYYPGEPLYPWLREAAYRKFKTDFLDVERRRALAVQRKEQVTGDDPFQKTPNKDPMAAASNLTPRSADRQAPASSSSGYFMNSSLLRSITPLASGVQPASATQGTDCTASDELYSMRAVFREDVLQKLKKERRQKEQAKGEKVIQPTGDKTKRTPIQSTGNAISSTAPVAAFSSTDLVIEILAKAKRADRVTFAVDLRGRLLCNINDDPGNPGVPNDSFHKSKFHQWNNADTTKPNQSTNPGHPASSGLVINNADNAGVDRIIIGNAVVGWNAAAKVPGECVTAVDMRKSVEALKDNSASDKNVAIYKSYTRESPSRTLQQPKGSALQHSNSALHHSNSALQHSNSALRPPNSALQRTSSTGQQPGKSIIHTSWGSPKLPSFGSEPLLCRRVHGWSNIQRRGKLPLSFTMRMPFWSDQDAPEEGAANCLELVSFGLTLTEAEQLEDLLPDVDCSVAKISLIGDL